MTPQPNFTESNEIMSDLDIEFFARNPSNFSKYNQPKGDHDIINDSSINNIFLLWRLFPNGVPVNRFLSFSKQIREYLSKRAHKIIQIIPDVKVSIVGDYLK